VIVRYFSPNLTNGSKYGFTLFEKSVGKTINSEKDERIGSVMRR